MIFRFNINDIFIFKKYIRLYFNIIITVALVSYRIGDSRFIITGIDLLYEKIKFLKLNKNYI